MLREKADIASFAVNALLGGAASRAWYAGDSWIAAAGFIMDQMG
jgi:hypothetical protein